MSTVRRHTFAPLTAEQRRHTLPHPGRVYGPLRRQTLDLDGIAESLAASVGHDERTIYEVLDDLTSRAIAAARRDRADDARRAGL